MASSAPGSLKEKEVKFGWFVNRFRDASGQSKKDYWSAVQSFWSSIQSIALVMALIMGGVWTYKTFSDLGSVNSSQAALENLTLRNTEIRNKQSAVNVEIDATQLLAPVGDKNLYISIVVTLKNTGTRFEVMCFEDPNTGILSICPTREDLDNFKYTQDEIEMLKGDIQDEQQRHLAMGRLQQYLAPVHVSRVLFDAGSQKLALQDSRDANLFRDDSTAKTVRGLDLRPGQTDSFTTVATVANPGVYRIAFSSLEPQKSTLLPGDLRPIWSASKFLVVRDNKELRSTATQGK